MNLNPQQRLAIEADDARILCRAAPGSGKTAVLTQRAARLLESGIHSSELLMLTFTRASAAEMRERLERRMPGRPARWWRQLQITTFHGWACSLLRTWHDVVGLPKAFAIRDEQDSDDLVIFAARELGKAPPRGQKARSGQWTSAKRLRAEDDVMERYRGLLREASAVDFDGLESLALTLLHSLHGDEIRRRYRHVLVDEGQDTSAEQQDLLDALTAEMSPGVSASLFVVGDYAQSIYAFRGADVAGFVGLGARPAWRTIDLATNYRSAPAIVAAATRLGHAMATPGLDQVPGRTDATGTIAELAAAEVPAEICAEAAGAWASAAVLSPTWALLEELAPSLDAAGIPYVITRRALQVWETEPARWLLRCLRVALNPHNHVDLWEALTAFTPRVSLGRWAEIRMRAMDSATSVLDVVCAQDVAPVLADTIRALGAQLAASAQGWPVEADALIARLRAELQSLHLDTRVEQLDEVEKAICAWGDEQQPGWSVADLLDWYAGRHITEATAAEATPDRVVLTTIHGAKGLEWPRVWVLGCEEGVLPRGDSSGAVEEQRRLAYVALTRGMDRVRLCRSGLGPRSRFIVEALREPRFVLESLPEVPDV